MTPYGHGPVAPGTVVLNKGVPLETPHNQIVHIRRTFRGVDFDYKVAFGPYPGGKVTTGRGEFRNPDPEWHTYQGYAFAWGWYPVLTTSRTKNIAEGTTMIVQIGTNFERTFLVHSGRDSVVRVEDIENPNTHEEIEAVDGYIEATGTAGSVSLSSVQSIPTSGEICEFVKYVIDVARAAGYQGAAWNCTSGEN